MATGDDSNLIDDRFLLDALRTLVEQLPFDVWVRDADDTMLFANDALRRNWGPINGRTVGASPVDAAVAETWARANARALAGETVKDEVIYDRDGGTRTFVGLVTPVRDGEKVRGTVGINLDVTGERRARAEAARLGLLLRGVFTNAPVAIGIRAVRGDDVVHVEDNPRSAALYGGTPDSLRGRSERELGIPPERTRATIARLRSAREARGPVAIEVVHHEPDGSLRTFEGMVIALDDPEEERYAFVAEDVTELRRLQTGLIRADRLASLGTLSASIGHEIGTSAAVALGQIEIAMKQIERGGPSDETLGGLREAQRALLRAVGVLRDMRALAVGATLGGDACDVGAAFDMVKDVLRRELAGVTFEERRLVGAEVAMSHSRLVQVLLNLLRNALEAHAQRIVVEVTRPTPDRVRVDVADDGPGIPEAIRAHLFEPFQSTKGEGTGLGLYVCRLLVSHSGGTIQAHPGEGGGTRMRVEIPTP
jgi:PAS domain S-box-containing protein